MTMFARMKAGPLAYAALGSVATIMVQQFGQAAWSSGLITTGTTVLLGACAAGVVCGVTLRRDLGGTDAPVVAPYLKNGGRAWEQALKGEEWLRGNGALSVPDAELDGFLRANLVGALVPLPPRKPNDWEFAFPEPVALLALALAVRACGHARHFDDLTYHSVLAGIDKAQGLADPVARKRAWDDARAGIPPKALQAVSVAYREAALRHGTRATFLMGLLRMARERGGVLASGQFVWLKEVDRRLWYALDNLGRSAFHVEGLAAMDHYLHEVRTGSPCVAPWVEGAMENLAEFSRDPIRCPPEPEPVPESWDA
jgi:intracellular multiplication protein IcmP